MEGMAAMKVAEGAKGIEKGKWMQGKENIEVRIQENKKKLKN